MAVAPGITVEGLAALRREARETGNSKIPEAIKKSHKITAEMVVKEALPNVPVRGGGLKGSVKSLASAASGRVKAGTPARVPYAPPIHWGWPSRGIKGRPFLADALERLNTGGALEQAFLDSVRAEQPFGSPLGRSRGPITFGGAPPPLAIARFPSL